MTVAEETFGKLIGFLTMNGISTGIRNMRRNCLGHVNVNITGHVNFVIPQKHLDRTFRHAIYF